VGALDVIERNGGDDGARTRDLRRDRFKVCPRYFNGLRFISMGWERQGPTRLAMKRPKTIRLLHAYFTRILADARGKSLRSLCGDPLVQCRSDSSPTVARASADTSRTVCRRPRTMQKRPRMIWSNFL